MESDDHRLSEFLTVRDVARMFGVSEGRVRVLARERGVGTRFGWGYLFTLDEVEKMRPGRSGIKRTPQKRKPPT